MFFSGIRFLYAFLPLSLALYYITPYKFKNAVLLLESLAFCYICERKTVIFVLASTVVNYAAALLLDRINKEKSAGKRLAVLIAVLIFDISAPFYFKYYGVFAFALKAVVGVPQQLSSLILPLGIGFMSLRTVGYVIDVFKKSIVAERNIVNFAIYIAFFPQYIAGPVARYGAISNDITERKHSFAGFSTGVRRFVFGLAKKVIIADSMTALIKTVTYSSEKTVLFSWIYAIALIFRVYYELSGYADMAIGLGHMFGFHLPENFNFPYISASMTEFLKRWNITLCEWFREYLFKPLCSDHGKKLRLIFSILAVCIIAGLWHSASWNCLIIGVILGLVLLAEGYFCNKVKKRLPRVVGIILTLFIVMMGIILFSFSDLKSSFGLLGGMFGFSATAFCGTESLYCLRGCAVIFVACAIIATPLLPKLVAGVNKKLKCILEPFVCIMLLLLCTGYMIDSSGFIVTNLLF